MQRGLHRGPQSLRQGRRRKGQCLAETRVSFMPRAHFNCVAHVNIRYTNCASICTNFAPHFMSTIVKLFSISLLFPLGYSQNLPQSFRFFHRMFQIQKSLSQTRTIILHFVFAQVPMAEVQNVLCSLGEKLEQGEAANLFTLLGIAEDEVSHRNINCLLN